jgi:hydrogenase maturation protein HypF
MRHLRIEVRGIVQGVGFRPFVYRIAHEHGINGTVSNNPLGVDITASGEGDQIYLFLKDLKDEAPPAAVVEKVSVFTIEPFEAGAFRIVPSTRQGEKHVLISPDLATCDDCASELFDESDRRYRYPFINCTNCGPRFTIISDTPYDRPNTSMAKFPMCPECRREYDDPADRRFHAQPNACPVCGPRVWLVDADGSPVTGDAVSETASLLKEGRIVALKGLGGFHLACDATSDEAVSRLRERKNRYGKPLAVMVRDIASARRYCSVDEPAEELLRSTGRPIVLLREHEDSALSRDVATGLSNQGLFLPYTPLHHLVLAEAEMPLVMTSGNVSSEPIAKDNDEALRRLSSIADYFLLHDRDILVRYDDSVSRVFRGAEYPLRRARGYAPYPVRVTPPAPVEVLAVGAELKNTFCLLRGEEAFLSQHIGDMETSSEMEHFEEALASIKRLFALEPKVVAHDLHPDYMTTQMAREMGMPAVGVQHHHAHIASCMAENRIEGPVLGVAWDGTGYGEDGTVWGGEFLLCDGSEYRRLAHLHQYPMPGADACIYKLYRMVMGILSELYADPDEALERLRRRFDIEDDEAESLAFQLKNKINSPLTSSAGRLFDAAAALSGLRVEAVYDGQAASELESCARIVREYYNFRIDRSALPWIVDTRQVFRELMVDVDSGNTAPDVAGKFHATMALAIVETLEALRDETGINRVALSGGVFQNELLTGWVIEGLKASGFQPHIHRRVPCNDGGVSLGQAVIAANKYNR